LVLCRVPQFALVRKQDHRPTGANLVYQFSHHVRIDWTDITADGAEGGAEAGKQFLLRAGHQ
jgi:hypothetical protein